MLALISFILGAATAELLPPYPMYFLAASIALAFIFLIFILEKRQVSAVVTLCLAAFFFSCFRGAVVFKNLDDQKARLSGIESLRAKGQVCSSADAQDKKTVFDLCTTEFFTKDWEKISAKIKVSAIGNQEIGWGDELVVLGKFYSSSKYTSAQIIGNINFAEVEVLGHQSGLYSHLLSIRDFIIGIAHRIYHEPFASLLLGLLVGVTAGFPQKLLDAFSATGTTHIVAISGMNISIIADILRRSLAFLGRKISFPIIVLVLLLFTLLTGASASVVRAAIMGVLLVAGLYFGRTRNITVAIVFAAAFMIYLNPLVLNYDLSFQLSFASTLGLIYLGPIFDKKFYRVPKILREPLSATLSAQAFSLPLIISAFGRISLISPLVNILILPFIPITTIIGFIIIMVGAFSYFWGMIFGWVGYLFLYYIISIIEFFGKLPFGSTKIANFDFSYGVIYYIILAIILFEYYEKPPVVADRGRVKSRGLKKVSENEKNDSRNPEES